LSQSTEARLAAMVKMRRVVYRLYVAVEHLADQVGVSGSIPDQVRAVRAPVRSVSSIRDVSLADRQFCHWTNAARQRGQEPTKPFGGAIQAYGGSVAESCQLSPVTALPVDNSIPGTKPRRMTTASLARPRSASPIGTGSPGAPSGGSTTNCGVFDSFCIGGVADFTGSGEVSSMESPVGFCQVSKKERYDGTAAMAAANMQPIKTFVMRPDLLSRCAGARRTSCPAKRSSGADALVDTFVLPPTSLATVCCQPWILARAKRPARDSPDPPAQSEGSYLAGRTPPLDSSCFIRRVVC
jgi:hypothetical protein